VARAAAAARLSFSAVTGPLLLSLVVAAVALATPPTRFITWGAMRKPVPMVPTPPVTMHPVRTSALAGRMVLVARLGMTVAKLVVEALAYSRMVQASCTTLLAVLAKRFLLGKVAKVMMVVVGVRVRAASVVVVAAAKRAVAAVVVILVVAAAAATMMTRAVVAAALSLL